jgi:hypothetical protein
MTTGLVATFASTPALMQMPSYVAGNWVALGTMGATGGASGGQTGWIKLFPFILRQQLTISQLGLNVATAHAGGNVAMALYTVDTSMLPTNLVDHTGALSTASTGPVSAALGSNQQLPPGLYWAASMIDNATAQYTSILTSTNASMSPLYLAIGNSSLANVLGGGNQQTGLIYNNTFGSWPGCRGKARPARTVHPPDRRTQSQAVGRCGYDRVL